MAFAMCNWLSRFGENRGWRFARLYDMVALRPLQTWSCIVRRTLTFRALELLDFEQLPQPALHTLRGPVTLTRLYAVRWVFITIGISSIEVNHSQLMAGKDNLNVLNTLTTKI